MLPRSSANAVFAGRAAFTASRYAAKLKVSGGGCTPSGVCSGIALIVVSSVVVGGSAELDLAAGKKVQHQRPPLRYRRAMRAAGRADQPARRAAVEAGVALDRHHEVDLAVRVHVVRSGDVLHVDDVDREAVQVVGRLED